MKEYPWYKFWNPRSGLAGGLLAGAVSWAVIFLTVFLIY